MTTRKTLWRQRVVAEIYTPRQVKHLSPYLQRSAIRVPKT